MPTSTTGALRSPVSASSANTSESASALLCGHRGRRRARRRMCRDRRSTTRAETSSPSASITVSPGVRVLCGAVGSTPRPAVRRPQRRWRHRRRMRGTTRRTGGIPAPAKRTRNGSRRRIRTRRIRSQSSRGRDEQTVGGSVRLLLHNIRSPTRCPRMACRGGLDLR